jgi:hypothetical protein
MGSATLDASFCDIGHSDSLAHLRVALAARLLHYRLDDLDAGDIRARAPRRLTQEIGRYVFERSVDGAPVFSGIRYASRLGDELTNWAIFEPHEPRHRDVDEIALDDADLVAVLSAYNLVLQHD